MSSDVQLLTDRQRTVLRLLADGATTAEAASRLRVKPATVRGHLERAVSKLLSNSMAPRTWGTLNVQAGGRGIRGPRRIDPLTHLPEKSVALRFVAREAARAAANSSTLALLLMEVEDLGAVAEEQGRDVRDAVLRSVARVLQATIRRNDQAFRWGDDSFLLVLPESNEQGARFVAIRVSAQAPGVAFSKGIVRLRPNEADVSLLARLEYALKNDRIARRAARSLHRTIPEG